MKEKLDTLMNVATPVKKKPRVEGKISWHILGDVDISLCISPNAIKEDPGSWGAAHRVDAAVQVWLIKILFHALWKTGWFWAIL